MVKENESRIDRSMSITGVVECHGLVVLEGVIEGMVSGGNLEITETGRLTGEVTAQSIDCAGRLEGNIVTDVFILRSTGCHVGTAETGKLTVDPGAVLDCVLQSGSPRAEKSAVKPYDRGAVPPTAHLSQVLPAFQKDVRPCCMDMPWSARLELFNHLMLLLDNGKPLVKVTGENGSGKSMLVAKLRKGLPECYEVLAITGQLVSVATLLQQIAADLAIAGAEDLAQNDLLKHVKAVLDDKRSRGLRVVLLVDDVQEMHPATVEGLIRLLTNACATGDDMLQMILLGTKEMETKIAATTFGYFEDQTNYQLYLEPMTIKDTADYLRFCLQRAAPGNGNASLSLLPYETIRTIHILSRGNIAEINRLADQALRAAHTAGASAIYPDFL